MTDIAMQLADDLAKATIELAEDAGDPNLIADVAKLLGSSSQTSEEFFMTAARVRLAMRRGHQFLEQRRAKAEADGTLGQGVDLSAQKILNAEDDNAGGH